MCKKIVNFFSRVFEKIKLVDFLPLLALRLYLVPILWMAGTKKWYAIESTASWFGNPDWGLGLPFPTLMAYMATVTEITGAILLTIGFAVRLISLPLMTIMVIAALAVHWDNGWLAIAHDSSEAHIRLTNFFVWLKQNYPARHTFVTELGSPMMLNNGIEFAVTYFIMLLTIFFYGAGSYFSVDYWLARYWHRKQ